MLPETAAGRGFRAHGATAFEAACDSPSLTVICLKHSLHPMATRKT
jgi:hypothetical protein